MVEVCARILGLAEMLLLDTDRKADVELANRIMTCRQCVLRILRSEGVVPERQKGFRDLP
jgi:hypothetical protein